MPVDFTEAGSQSVSSLFSPRYRRGVLSSVAFIFSGRRQAPARLDLVERQVICTIHNVLTYLAHGVDPTAPGTPSCCHRILLAEVIGILCLLNDRCHLR
jgi:hypothetical protein